MEWKIKFDNKNIIIRVSKRKNKKYDAFLKDKYLFSFGDTRYEHFFDKFGYYHNLNHNDKERRKNYLNRSEKISDYGLNANTFSREYLW